MGNYKREGFLGWMSSINVKHLDLCSGVGGFCIAAGWAGFETVGFSEIDPYCCELIAERWPGIKNYGDLRIADFDELRGGVDVISAGVPCQSASLAGKRRGAGDERWLWSAVCDVVGRVEPAWVLFENPVGILSLDEFAGVLLRLESFGYAVRAFSVPANAVGAKHRRQRVFVVAHARSIGQRKRTSEWSGEIGWRTSIKSGRTSSNAEALAESYSQRCSQREECDGESEQSEFQSSRWDDIERCGGPYGFRLTQPPLCGRADGVRNRSHRLKALGNAVVPQQAYPFFAAIAQVEAMRR